MSPEQASGDASIDHRTDQYSLAVVGYQMASGRVPFQGDTPRAVITKLLLEPPPPLADLVEHLPSPIAYAIHRALEKNPNQRFASIVEFAAALTAEAPANRRHRDSPGMVRRSPRRTR